MEILNAIKFHSTKVVTAYISRDRLIGQNENTTSYQLNMSLNKTRHLCDGMC